MLPEGRLDDRDLRAETEPIQPESVVTQTTDNGHDLFRRLANQELLPVSFTTLAPLAPTQRVGMEIAAQMVVVDHPIDRWMLGKRNNRQLKHLSDGTEHELHLGD